MKLMTLSAALLLAIGCGQVCKDLTSFPGIEEKAHRKAFRKVPLSLPEATDAGSILDPYRRLLCRMASECPQGLLIKVCGHIFAWGRKAGIFCTFAALLLCFSANAQKTDISLPDGRIVLTVDNSSDLNYRITFDGETIVGKSPLGFEFVGEKPMT